MSLPAVSNSAPPIPQSGQELRLLLADKTVEAIQRIADRNLQNKGVQYPEEYLRRMKAEKGSIPQNFLGFQTYGFATKEFFQTVERDKIHWIVKPDVSASKALEAALNGPTLVDCGIACTLALHKALLDVIGHERYDKIFNGRLVLVADKDVPDPMGLFTQKANKIAKGTLVGFKNHKAYSSRHPFGLWGSFNMCCVDKNRYVGLGTTKDGLTEAQIKALFVREFNKPYDPLLDGIVPREKLLDLLNENSATEEKLLKGDDVQIQEKDVPGMDPEFIQEFHLPMVEKVLKTKPEDLSFEKLVAFRRQK